MPSQAQRGPGGFLLRIAAVAIVLVLLATTTAAAPLVIFRSRGGSGWWLESVETTGDVTVIPGWTGSGEITGQLIHLYDSSGNFLIGTSSFWRGGDMIDARVSVAGQAADARDQVPDQVFFSGGGTRFQCGTAGGCGNVNSFRVLVVVSSDNLSFGAFRLYADQATIGAGTSGLDQGIASTRSFDGVTATLTASNLAGQPIAGVHAASGATKTVSADNTLAAIFVTPSASAVMSVPSQSPNACDPCVVARGAPGDHVFRYDDVDADGREGFLLWADVPFS